jgi:NAD(P)-dependent dehydrogenase (short-subunit alcohol dehydrogenase family)
MKTLTGQVALVTGATRGLGKGIAIGLGEAGATVYITGRSLAPNSEASMGGSLQETAAAVTAAGGTCIPVGVDHRDDHQVRSLFAQIQSEQQGRLDLLVNNAFGGVGALRNAQGGGFWEMDPSLWDACNQVGLRSHYIASHHAAQMMAPRQRGLICTLSSWGGLAYLFGAAYGAGKSGCDRLAADMAVELKPHGVASLVLWPGIVGTEHISELTDELSQSPSHPDPRAQILTGRYNWENPLLTGRVIAKLAADPNVMDRTGKVGIIAELARHYGVVDQTGNQPASLRSLRFLLPARFPWLQPHAGLVPDLRVPWWMILNTTLQSPRV